MANRVISIEVGRSITHAVEMDYKVKRPKIYSCFSFETPEGVLEDGILRADENFCNILRGAMRHFRVKTRKAVFTVNSSRIANREIKIPLVSESKIPGLLMANSAEYFPVDLAQYQLVHRIDEKVNTKEEKYYRLAVLAVPNELIKAYEKFSEACGLTLHGMDYVGNSIGQAMHASTEGEGGMVLIKIDEDTSLLTITENGKVKLQRNVTYGVSDAIETMIETNAYGEELAFADALQIMRRKTCIRRHLDVEIGYSEDEDTDQTIATARADITESLRMLISNIGRVLDYYISRNAEADIRHIQLVGLGADCSGLSKLMTNELGIKVTVFQDFSGINLSRIPTDGGFKIAEYTACIGAAISPMEFRLGEAAESASEDSMLLPGAVFTVCLLASAALVGFSLFRTHTLKEERDDYNAAITELYPAKQIYLARNAALEERNACMAMYALTTTPVDHFLDFVAELEQNMPSDIMISGLSTNAGGVTMNVTVSSKESLAKAIMQFREFKTISAISCNAMSEQVDELGNVKVSAAVSCTFNTQPADAAAAN